MSPPIESSVDQSLNGPNGSDDEHVDHLSVPVPEAEEQSLRMLVHYACDVRQQNAKLVEAFAEVEDVGSNTPSESLAGKDAEVSEASGHLRRADPVPKSIAVRRMSGVSASTVGDSQWLALHLVLFCLTVASKGQPRWR